MGVQVRVAVAECRGRGSGSGSPRRLGGDGSGGSGGRREQQQQRWNYGNTRNCTRSIVRVNSDSHGKACSFTNFQTPSPMGKNP